MGHLCAGREHGVQCACAASRRQGCQQCSNPSAGAGASWRSWDAPLAHPHCTHALVLLVDGISGSDVPGNAGHHEAPPARKALRGAVSVGQGRALCEIVKFYHASRPVHLPTLNVPGKPAAVHAMHPP